VTANATSAAGKTAKKATKLSASQSNQMMGALGGKTTTTSGTGRHRMLMFRHRIHGRMLGSNAAATALASWTTLISNVTTINTKSIGQTGAGQAAYIAGSTDTQIYSFIAVDTQSGMANRNINLKVCVKAGEGGGAPQPMLRADRCSALELLL
jgi:hypothetical protein